MRVLLIVGMAALAVGCGIPLDATPQRLEVDPTGPPVADEPVVTDLTTVSVYLVQNEQLIRATRELPGPVSLTTVVSALLRSASGLEDRDGLRTSIPSGTRLLSARQVGSVAHIDLSGDFVAVGGEEEILAVAQIVLTATSLEDVSSVLFLIEGLPTGVPVAGGALSTDPVGPDDYLDLIAP